jgi:uncharacterized protein
MLFFLLMLVPASPTAVFKTRDHTTSVTLEIADTDATRQRGLMFRGSLKPDNGMLFIFPHASKLSFWMKNTLIPLDIIFIDETLHVVGVVANAQPLSLEPRSVSKPSKYVIEVNGGFAAKHGIESGCEVILKSLPKKRGQEP